MPRSKVNRYTYAISGQSMVKIKSIGHFKCTKVLLLVYLLLSESHRIRSSESTEYTETS